MHSVWWAVKSVWFSCAAYSLILLLVPAFVLLFIVCPCKETYIKKAKMGKKKIEVVLYLCWAGWDFFEQHLPEFD